MVQMVRLAGREEKDRREREETMRPADRLIVATEPGVEKQAGKARLAVTGLTVLLVVLAGS